MDIVPSETRSRMMSGIRGKNTKPELLIRKALHHRGFRFRLYDKTLPGKPDIVLPKYHAVIQVQGCFWHGHNCHLFKWPSSRSEFWKDKIEGNRERDIRNQEALLSLGWRIFTLWECALKGKTRLPFDQVVSLIESWLLVGNDNVELMGIQSS